MTFDEWWELDISTDSVCKSRYDKAEAAWEAGVQEGLRRNREWVGLTDDEMNDVRHKFWHEMELLRTLEAKLNEKNT